MELWNSLGCKICRKPLELCESINLTSIKKNGHLTSPRNIAQQTKFEGTFRQQLQQGAKAEELDPQPVAAKCGHIYHRGCLKRLTTELNSSCIECLICLKPIVLNQALPITFYSPQKDPKGNRTLSTKVHHMNEKNNSLQDELVEVRRLRAHKEAEHREVCQAIKAVQHSIQLRSQELDNKLVELFGTPNLDERYEENVRYEKEAILQRVKDLTNKNSQLLANIEERAKSHYINEGEEGKDEQGKVGENGQQSEKRMDDKTESPIPAKILVKPAQVSRQSRHNNACEPKVGPLKTASSNEKNLCDHLEELLRGLPAANRGCTNLANRSKESMRIPTGDRAADIQHRIPLASVTRSMQQLFEQEKLKYLQKNSRKSSHDQSSSSSTCDSSDDSTRHMNEITDHGDGSCRGKFASSRSPVVPRVPTEGLVTRPSRKKPEVGFGDNVDSVVFPEPLNNKEKGFSTANILNRQAERAKNSPKPLSTKNLKFVPARVSIKGKRSFMKSQPSSQFKLAFPTLATEQKQQPVRAHDLNRVVLHASKQRRQNWKPHVIGDPPFKTYNDSSISNRHE